MLWRGANTQRIGIRVAVFVVPMVVVGALCLAMLVKRLFLGSPSSADVIPAGAVIVIRVAHPLSSQTAHLGDRFQARLEAVKGTIGILSGLLVEGRCIAAQRSGLRAGYLRLTISELRDLRGHRLPLRTTTLSQWGKRVLGVDASSGAALNATPEIPGLYSTPKSEAGEAVITPQAQLSFVLLEPLVAAGHRSHLSRW
jgi:hypothetical protein